MSEPFPQHEPERASSRDLNLLRPALRFLRPYIRQIAAASVALVVTASVTLSVGQGVRVIIDSGFGSADPQLLSQSLVLFGVLVLALTIGTFVRFYFVSWVGERVSADIRSAVYAHLVDLHPGFFEVNQPTEIQSRITTDTTLLQTVIGSSVSIALRNLLMFLGGVVLLLITNPKLTLIVLGSIPLVIAPIILFGRRVRSLSRSSQDSLADVGSYAGESLRNIKVLQAYNHQAADCREFDRRVESAFAVAIRRVRQRSVLIAMVMLLVMGAIAAMLWVGGQDVLGGRTSAGELAAFVFYAFIVAGSVGAISEVLSDLQRAAGATERLMELLSAPNALPDPQTDEPVEQLTPEASTAAAIAFESVSFVYPTRPGVTVLDKLSFAIERGEFVALVGPSGAGKSTLFDLVLRFYDPLSGVVRFNGVDVRNMRRTQLRQNIAIVPQDAALLAGSIRELVGYSLSSAKGADERVDDARVEAALRKANALEFVELLPEGVHTRLGEAGVGLSGGQRQRLAIARALYSEPKILLLDEATSALDAESEAQIRDTMFSLRGQCTVLAIAHRLSTVIGADRIFVLDGGSVEAVGTHDQLLRDSALYARYAKVQFDSPNNTSCSSNEG
jgi:ATP-binding cassette subfamily B protein